MQGKSASQGASLLCGGQRIEGELAAGLYYEPTVLGGVNKDMLITYQETFGPVAPIIPFSLPTIQSTGWPLIFTHRI
ncbi:hypothetical protein GCM10009597_14690 [Peribacillus frigoritolerans]|nr:aldehyde dehydrogenase family protein [Peribacillus frigoritolerans]